MVVIMKRMVMVFVISLVPVFSSAGGDIQEKLDRIMLDRVEIRDVTLGEAVDYLRKISRELDPEKTGVNFVFKDIDKNAAKIDIDLTAIPLGEALKYICLNANAAFHVEKYAVVISSREKKDGVDKAGKCVDAGGGGSVTAPKGTKPR